MSNAIKNAPVLTIGQFKDDSIIRNSATNADWGSVMLNHETYSFLDGAMFKSRRVAFFRAELDNISVLEKVGGELKAGENFNDKLVALGLEPMRIVRRESFEPQFEGHTAKTKGEGGEQVLVDGKPVYMQDILIPVSSEETDSLLRNLPATATATAEEEEVVEEEGKMS